MDEFRRLVAAVNRSGPSAWWIAAAGMLSQVVAIGLGRFSFTPLLPLMLDEGRLSLIGGSAWAAANFAGYLLGALVCMAAPWLARRRGAAPPDAARWVRVGLITVSGLSLAVAWAGWGPGLVFRFGAGLAGAVIFVFTSSWCLAQLAARGQAQLGGLVFAGPGVGIVVSGLLVHRVQALGGDSVWGWLLVGTLACALTAVVWSTVRPDATPTGAPPPAAHGPSAGLAERGVFALAYGLSGFGYSITATYLPVIAGQSLPGSPWVDRFWPLLGVAVVVGALLATRLPARFDVRRVLVLCYLVQAAGVVWTVWWPGVWGFVLGCVWVGLPFNAINFFGMQEARRLVPSSPASLMGLATAVYGLGQMAGPPLAAAVIAHRGQSRGFSLSLEVAASALVLGAGLFAALVWRRPRR